MGEKGKKGVKWENVGERGEPSGGLGMGKGHFPLPRLHRRFFAFPPPPPPPNVEPGPRLSKLGVKMLFSLVCQCFEYSVRVLKCMLLTN